MRAFATHPRVQGCRPVAARAIAAPAKPASAPFKGEQPTTARVQYVRPAPNSEDLFTYLYEKPDDEDRWTNLEQSESEVPVTDLYSVTDKFTLERNGFQLEKLHVPDDIDWDDDDDVSNTVTVVTVLNELLSSIVFTHLRVSGLAYLCLLCWVDYTKFDVSRALLESVQMNQVC